MVDMELILIDLKTTFSKSKWSCISWTRDDWVVSGGVWEGPILKKLTLLLFKTISNIF